MSKLRVHDMAGEFGVSTDEVINLLRQMDVPVRTHLTLLTDDQVSRVRARWEREKRVRAERAAQAAAPVATRRRRGAAEQPVTAPPPPAAEPTVAGVRRRVRPVEQTPPATDVAVANGAAFTADAGVEADAVDDRTVATESTPSVAAPSAAQPAAPADAARVILGQEVPRADVVPQAGAAADAAVEPTRVEVARGVEGESRADRGIPARGEPAVSDRAAASAPAAPPAGEVVPPRPAAPQWLGGGMAPGATPVASASPSSGAGGATVGPTGPRPRPLTPGAPRPRQVVPGAPRPVASASPSVGAIRRDERRPPGAPTPGGPGTGYGGGAAGGATGTPSRDAGRRGGKKNKRGVVDQQAVTDNISRTLQGMRGAPARRGVRREDGREEMEALRAAEAQRERTTVRVNEFITVSELAQSLKVSPTQIVGFALKNLGLMVTINQRLDFDQIDLIAAEFGFQAVREEEYLAGDEAEGEADRPEDLAPRPPVVTIMGHVDHGKTSLLDYVRKANVVAGEAGGITQHIGAYHVTVGGGRNITFLDTPGHEAFTAMRARGAQVTDIVVLVVAADDSIMPQTVEAISHARNAGVPMIVAINKIDLATANPGKVKQELLQHNVVLEEYGGTVLSTEISAKKGTNVSDLLDQVLLQAEILDLKANPSRRAVGAVVEAQLDPGKGPVATVLVQNGVLNVGDDFICGIHAGRVRALLDERGKVVKRAGPAIPVQILGLTGVPQAGDQLLVVEDATQAREIAQRRERLDREAKSRRTAKGVTSLDDIMSQAAAGEKRTLKLLIKADQGGPAEALADALGQLSSEEVTVDIIQRSVGAITEGDILLAKAAGAVIVGFHVRPDTKARAAAEREGVDIRLYRIIYEAVNEIRSALEGMLAPEKREVVLGEAEVRETFKVARVGTIAGCSVRSGIISRKGRVRVVRDGVELYDGALASLRRFKDDVNEVREGFECGIGVENFNDIKVGDVLECYRTEEVARSLAASPA